MRWPSILASFFLLCSPLCADPPPPEAHAIAPTPAPLPDPQTVGAKLKRYDAGPYVIYTDLPPDDAREAVLRMRFMAEEYQSGTRALFSRPILNPLPFYLFSKPADYHKASNRPDSAGVFTGDVLLATVLPDLENPGPTVGLRTWRLVQHEGFHQFADAAGRAQMPTWINEGLAEYFSQSLFTGDGMISGIIPASRLRIIQDGIRNAEFKPFPRFLRISQETWNLSLTHAQYDQAWSMVQFLMHADHGKCQPALAQAILLSSQRLATDRAWITMFGSIDAFEEKWKDYWLKLPENPSLDLYSEAVVSTFASYLGRAAGQGQAFAEFDALLKVDAPTLRAPEEDWLPPALLKQMKALAADLKTQGVKFAIVGVGKDAPRVVCTMPDGTELSANFAVKENGHIAKVIVKREVKREAKPEVKRNN